MEPYHHHHQEKKRLLSIFSVFLILLSLIVTNVISSDANENHSLRTNSEKNEAMEDGNNFIDSSGNDESDYMRMLLKRNSTDWDFLIFTQQWPITTCYQWKASNPNHNCSLPDENSREFWTVHGIWPTKTGDIGPNFCNKSAKFDVNQLNAILDDLEMYWPEIENEKGTDNLWKHEWLKHGTCAAQLIELKTEKLYFSKGIEWRKRYSIGDLLLSFGIKPNSDNTVININSAIRKALNANPSIHCYYDRKNDISYLSEIRICFNKTLDLVDCDELLKFTGSTPIDYPGGKLITNCHISKPVHYPSSTPPADKNKWKFPIVNFYKLLNFIMWYTL